MSDFCFSMIWELLRHLVFWLHAKVSVERTASIIRAISPESLAYSQNTEQRGTSEVYRQCEILFPTVKEEH
jgi:hypothetical protein